MEDLAKQIARWYDIEIFFPDDAARKVSFTGAMERYKPVSYFIEMINATNTAECLTKRRRHDRVHGSEIFRKAAHTQSGKGGVRRPR